MCYHRLQDQKENLLEALKDDIGSIKPQSVHVVEPGEWRLREILSRQFMQHLDSHVLGPGEFDHWLNRISARDIDPYAAAAQMTSGVLGGRVPGSRDTTSRDTTSEVVSDGASADTTSEVVSPDAPSIDHVGIAVADVDASLKFFTGVLGLSSDAPQDIKGQNTRVRFVDTGDAKLELVESLAPGSAIGKFIEKRGPGLHHVALRVPDVRATIAHLVAAGVRMIDQAPRRGAHGSLIAFVHPADTHGVLVELKQLADPEAP